jgi:hypothetical protein
MNENQYTNFLISTLVILLIIGYILIYTLWFKFGNKGLIYGFILTIIIDIIALYMLKKISMRDKNGSIKQIGDIIGDMLSVTFTVTTFAIIIAIIVWIIGFKIAKNNNERIIAFMIPIINTCIVLLSLLILKKF